jgi:hypothetical protein
MLRRCLSFIIGAVGFLLLMEAVLRLLPVPQGLELVDGYGSPHLLRYRPGEAIVYSRDWDFLYARRGRVNPYGYHGFCNPSAKPGQHRLWVVGDSYAEALMVDEAFTIAGRLQQARPDLSVCTAGISGAPGSEYLAMLDEVGASAQGDTWVILLNTADIPESAGGREGFHYFSATQDAEFTGQRRTESRSLAWARHSAAFRFVNYSLNAKGTLQRFQCELRIKRCASEGAEGGAAAGLQGYEELASRWIAALTRRAAQRDAKVVVVLNAFDPSHFPTPQLQQLDATQRRLLKRLLTRSGVEVVDVEEAFNGDPECRRDACYLFRDGHWSPSGHGVLASRVAAALASRWPGR